MKLFRTLTITIAALFLYLNSFPWGSIGHKITANIAEEHLNQRTKDSVAYYLGNKTMRNASVWMDEIRSDHSYDYLKPLHYINIEKGESYDPNSQVKIISELNMDKTAPIVEKQLLLAGLRISILLNQIFN